MDATALAPAVDLELKGNCAARPDAGVVEGQLRDFVTSVESATGQPVVFYVSKDFEKRYPTARWLDRSRWDYRPLRRPSTQRWTLWQVTGFAHVDGIAGRVDLDVERPSR